MSLHRPPAACISDSGVHVQVQEVENFFETDGLNLHQAYGEETHWLADQGRFMPGREPPIRKLKNMLMLYQAPVSGTVSSATGVSNWFEFSWEDVLMQLEIAKASCLVNDKKASRKADRFLAKAASYTEKWIDLIPDEYGLSVVRGGLGLVFSTAAQKVENREKIILAFEDIPDMIRTMETACKLFGSDDEEDVKQLAKAFYDELCSDIPDLIQILDGKSSSGLAAGAPETHKIDEILERIGRRSSKLESSIKRIKMRLDAKERSEIASIRAESKTTQFGMGLIYSDMQQLPTRSDFDNFARGFEQSIVKKLRNEFREEMQSGFDQFLRNQTQGDFAAEAKTVVLKMIEENASLRNQNAQLAAQNRQIEYQRSRQPSPIAGPFVSSLDLMRILDIDHQQPTKDLQFVLTQAVRMGPDSQGRARWLLRTPNFQKWLSMPRNSLLLVDGAMPLERVSPMSILTATLTVNLLQVPSTLVIYFFCGKNLDVSTEDEPSGPRGMLRSLITQLMLQISPVPNLSGINSHEFLHDCYRHHYPALCEVLKLLIEQLPPHTTLYCLLDGVSWYEREAWVDDMRFFVGLFRHLMAQADGPSLKLFMASSNKSTEIRGLVHMEWEYVSLAAASIDSLPLISPSIVAAMAPR
ncbi:hypothetical protein NUW58_g2410 [Xylaria curta]|uniref:Uncharacterized protein n=1 Tax=Xylaria curta TaxID=42375 RepID=A0ACC1PFR0_9PEZI|nr:hypothetical protein NUW58_g2410 [Xylaria curta]